MYPVPPARETQGLTDKYISTWLKDQKREDIVLATKVWGCVGSVAVRQGTVAPAKSSCSRCVVREGAAVCCAGHQGQLQLQPGRFTELHCLYAPSSQPAFR